jgi:hypothetical protein
MLNPPVLPSHLALLVLLVPQVLPSHLVLLVPPVLPSHLALPVLLGLPSLIVVLGLNPSLNQMQSPNQSQRLNPSPNPSLNGVPVQNIRINRAV